MHTPLLHQQIIISTERLRDMHRAMMIHTTAIPSAELESFVQEIRKLYETALQLNYRNAIRLLEDMNSSVQSLAAESTVQPKATEEKIEMKKEEILQPAPSKEEHKSTNSLLADISVTGQDPKKKIVADIQGVLGDQHTLGNKFESRETLGNRIASAAPGVTSVGHKITHSPVKDLKSAIGLNEKFQFINQLFKGKSDQYNTAIEYLNSCGTVDKAHEYLKNISSENNWEQHAAPASLFMELIERRYLA
jgi:hypothetical protein